MAWLAAMSKALAKPVGLPGAAAPDRREMTIPTAARLASLTRPFTAAAILRLPETGRLKPASPRSTQIRHRPERAGFWSKPSPAPGRIVLDCVVIGGRRRRVTRSG